MSYPFKHRRDKNVSDIRLPFVSIIVPARNEQDNIERCILSLLNQDYPNFEVIVVDDNSTENTLKIVQDIKSRVNGQSEEQEKKPLLDRLKIISLSEKPDKWTGKTWASEQGYLHSTGNILLFTDADTCYMSRDAILLTVSYMQKRNLDVLTGIPLIELRDFWSKITMPLWNHFSILLGANTGAMNNPGSKVAYLIGSFFLIRKKVLEEVGTFRSVRNAIQEDRELGMRVKNAGYNIKMVRIENIVSALWSRDVRTMWYGIARTFVPMRKWHIFANLVAVFFMALLPFVLLSYTSSFVINTVTITNNIHWMIDISNTREPQQLGILSFFMNATSCVMIIIATALKDIKKYKMTPIYSLLSFLGAGLIVLSYIANMITLFSKRTIPWRGRSSRITESNKVQSSR
jgi:chlorobactene glucosyltransferase